MDELAARQSEDGAYDERTLLGELAEQRLEFGLLYRRAEREDLQAMCQLAGVLVTYAMTSEHNRDDLVDSAERWLRRALRAGSTHAAGRLGELLLDCRTGREAHEEGERLLRRAASAGDPVAMRALGIALVAGDALAENQQEGWSWLSRAATAGDWLARHVCGARTPD